MAYKLLYQICLLVHFFIYLRSILVVHGSAEKVEHIYRYFTFAQS